MASGDFVIDEGAAEPVEPSFFRQKALEFQEVINALDATSREVDQLIGALPESALLSELIAQKESLESKKTQIRLVAEAINAASSIANTSGMNLPSVNLPQTLGIAPALIFGAGAAAIAAAAAIIVWGREWIAGVNQRLRDQQLIESVPESDRPRVVEAIQRTQAAEVQADASPLVTIAGIVKWIAIGAVAYFAYQAYSDFSGRQAIAD